MVDNTLQNQNFPKEIFVVHGPQVETYQKDYPPPYAARCALEGEG